jgi:fibronectin-binding autotransporter adhesin
MIHRYKILAALILALGLAHADSITSTWTGGYAGWNTASNWNPSGVPNSLVNLADTFNVVIDGTAAPLVDVSARVASMAIGTTAGLNSGLQHDLGYTLTVDQNFTNSGIVQLNGGSQLAVGGDLTNSGFFYTNNHGAGATPNSITVGGTLTNSNRFFLDAVGGSHDTLTTGSFKNTGGTFSVNTGATFNVTNSLDISGGMVSIQGNFNGLSQLNSFTGGTLALINQNLAITPAFHGGTFTTGGILELDGSRLAIAGNALNSGFITTDGIFGRLGTGPAALNLTGTLTNNGTLSLAKAGSTASLGGLVNSGNVLLAPGSSLTLTNQPGGLTSVGAGSFLQVGGTFVAGNRFALANLQTVNGSLTLNNGQTLSSTGNLAIGSAGLADVAGGTSWTINGDVSNQGRLGTQIQSSGSGNALNITGTLNNGAGATFRIASGDSGNLGVLANLGTVTTGTGSILTVGTGLTSIAAGSTLDLFGRFVTTGGGNALAALQTIAGNLLVSNGQTFSSTPASGTLTLAPTGTLSVGGGTNWTINGNLRNSGTLGFDANQQLIGARINGVVNVTGEFNNAAPLQVGGTINANSFVNTGGTEGSPGGAFHIAGTFTQTGGAAGIFTLAPGTTDFTASRIYVDTGFFEVNGFSAGTVDIENGAQLFGTYGSIGAPLTMSGGNPYLGIASSGVLIDNGSVNFAAVTNAGTVNIGRIGTLSAGGSYTQSGGITTVDGTLVATAVNINGGTLAGSGKIVGSSNGDAATVAIHGGAIRPSDRLTITGNLGLDANTVFFEDISSGTTFGSIFLSGSADIGGMLDINLLNGFQPFFGEQFTILTAAGGLHGMFSGVQALANWLVSYDNNQVTLTANFHPTPEPVTFLMMGAGLVLLSRLRVPKRRR